MTSILLGGGLPTVWHLHGSIDDAENLILTQEGYKDLYSLDPEENLRWGAALGTLKTLLFAGTILFVGLSFRDPYFGLLLSGLRKLLGSTKYHYALVLQQDVERVNAMNLPLVVIPFPAFGEPLRLLVQELAEISGSALSTAGTGPLDESKVDPTAAMVYNLTSRLGKETHDKKFADEVLKAGLVGNDPNDMIHKIKDASILYASHLHSKQQEIRANLSIISDSREKIKRLTTSVSEQIKSEVIITYKESINDVIIELHISLSQATLAEPGDGFFVGCDPRELSRRAAKHCEKIVARRLKDWQEYCISNILIRNFETLFHNITDDIKKLGKEDITEQIYRIFRDQSLKQATDEILSEFKKEIQEAVPFALQISIRRDFTFHEIFVYILESLFGLNLNVLGGIKQMVKEKTLTVAETRLRDSNAEHILNREVKRIINGTAKQLRGAVEVILDITEQNIKLSSESIKESEAEVGDFLNYLADERRRVEELRELLNPDEDTP